MYVAFAWLYFCKTFLCCCVYFVSVVSTLGAVVSTLGAVVSTLGAVVSTLCLLCLLCVYFGCLLCVCCVYFGCCCVYFVSVVSTLCLLWVSTLCLLCLLWVLLCLLCVCCVYFVSTLGVYFVSVVSTLGAVVSTFVLLCLLSVDGSNLACVERIDPRVTECGIWNWTSSMMTSSNRSIFRVTGPLCGEFTGPGEFPTQRPVTRSFDVFFDLRLNKRWSKQPWGWWFETPSWSLWRQCNDAFTVQNRSMISHIVFRTLVKGSRKKPKTKQNSEQYTTLICSSALCWWRRFIISHLLPFCSFWWRLWAGTSGIMGFNPGQMGQIWSVCRGQTPWFPECSSTDSTAAIWWYSRSMISHPTFVCPLLKAICVFKWFV